MSNAGQALFVGTCLTPDNSAVGWDEAIAEARRQIEDAHAKISKLNLSIRTFEEMRDMGEPFPSESQK